jgi:putative endopeptidase
MLRQFAFACVIGLACPVMSMAEPRAGTDLFSIDSAVPPQQDFWQFANGRWLAATSIPSDRSAWDTFSQLRETTQMQLRNVIESIDSADATHPERRKLADLYAAFMDEAGVEQAGLGGLHDALQRIHGLRDKADLPGLLAELSRLWVRIPWDIDIYPDEHDATVYAAHLGQGRLGLPDRDYYLKDEPRFQS